MHEPIKISNKCKKFGQACRSINMLKRKIKTYKLISQQKSINRKSHKKKKGSDKKSLPLVY